MAASQAKRRLQRKQYGRGMKTFQTKNTLQRGYGRMAIYRGQPLQRGHGFGGLLKGLARIAIPIIKRSLVKSAPIIRRTLVSAGKKALKSAGKRALKTAAYVVKDVAKDGRSLKESINKRSSVALRKEKNKLIKEAFKVVSKPINTSAPKRKSNTNVRRSKIKRKRPINAPTL